ncbi:uncharacterized protein B0H18DRAFT_519072 [Fomitopsis serialis]|uniref:uncharacterized protein n=1 Tax=Fomitopsis serialis TaxID=139415 RepID=UPI002007C13D|nr:uncharacterized protein B0H18DRAFT_519072 [Neoantrodia serialis]KAH9922429.1 hypothetical protein B0H18DRAFT_519072 [Neoantrodia serialis]
MSNALPAIGAHCALSSCNLNDFLPIRCACDRLFCRDHVAPDRHGCPVAAERMASVGEARTTLAREKCAKDGCGRPSLDSAVRDEEGRGQESRTPAVCGRCGRCFCAYHRDPSSHSCSPITPNPPPKNQAARDLLVKNFPTTSSSASKPAARAKKPVNKQNALMQMRRRAQPADPKDDRPSVNVPVGERLHVEVEVEVEEGLRNTGSAAGTQNVYWFRKNIGAGRAVDMLARRMSISTADPLQLVKVTGEDISPLRNDAPLAGQVEDASVLRLARRV